MTTRAKLDEYYHKEKIGHLHNRFEEKSVYKILNCRVNVTISVPICNMLQGQKAYQSSIHLS